MSTYTSPYLPVTGTTADTFDLHLGGDAWLTGFSVEDQQLLSEMLADNGYNVYDHIGQHMHDNHAHHDDATRPVAQWHIRAHRTTADCTYCGGTGSLPSLTGGNVCKGCNGTGMDNVTLADCAYCDGTGGTGVVVCGHCTH